MDRDERGKKEVPRINRELITTIFSRRLRPVRRTDAQALLRRALRSLSLEENDNAESAQSDGAA